MARPRIDLEIVGIPVGATLTLRGRDDVACVVVCLNPPRIAYGDEVVSLSRGRAESVWQGTGRNDNRTVAI